MLTEEKVLEFKICGRIPSKKNSTIAMARGKRIFHFASNKYREWNKDALKQLQYGGEPIERTLWVELVFVLPDKRKTDLSNKAESVLDTLVDAGILKDDNCEVISQLTLKYLGVSKEPSCLVKICV